MLEQIPTASDLFQSYFKLSSMFIMENGKLK